MEYPLRAERFDSFPPLKKANFYWRIFATGLGFTLFGTGGLLLCATVFPAIILTGKNADIRSHRVRLVIRFTFKVFLRILDFLGILHIESKNLDELMEMKGKLVICNHPSLLDVVIIISRLKNIQCVVNNKLWKNFFVGFIVRAAGYIRNDIPPEVFLERCTSLLAKGENIIIFPEGTRSIPGQALKFQRGFANFMP